MINYLNDELDNKSPLTCSTLLKWDFDQVKVLKQIGKLVI